MGSKIWLVPVDSSIESWRALWHVSDIASKSDKIILLFVQDQDILEHTTKERVQHLIASAHSLLERCSNVLDDLGFTSVEQLLQSSDHVGECIISVGKTECVDYIVMGCRGTKGEGITAPSKGSVSQYVLDHSSVPVLLTGKIYYSPAEAHYLTETNIMRSHSGWGPVNSRSALKTIGKLDDHKDFDDHAVKNLLEKVVSNWKNEPNYHKEKSESLLECRKCHRERKLKRFKYLDDQPSGFLAKVLKSTSIESQPEKDFSPKPPQTFETISSRLPKTIPYTIPSQGVHSERKHVLMRIPISTIFNSHQLVCIDTKTKMLDALTIMRENWIQSALVHNKKQKIIGFVSVVDILQYWYEKILSSDNFHGSPSSAIQKTRISKLKNSKGVMPGNWVPLCEHDSIYRLMNCFSFGCKAIPITNLKGDLLGIVTPSDLLHFLNVNQNQLIPESLLKQKLDSSCVEDVYLKFHAEMPTWTAFKLMLSENQPAVPIINQAGQLIAGISFNYAKGLCEDNLVLLCHSVVSFIELVLPQSWNGITVIQQHPTLAEVLDLIDRSPSHHIYSVDEEKNFKGLIFPEVLIGTILNGLLQLDNDQ